MVDGLLSRGDADYLTIEILDILTDADERERHWGAVERYFSGGKKDNIFVLDFTKPRSALDDAYPVVKHMVCVNVLS